VEERRRHHTPNRLPGAALMFEVGTGCWWDGTIQGWHVVPQNLDAALVVVRLQPT
jgi:hypothetical protein